MSSLKQTPSILDLYIVKGDDFTFAIISDTDLSEFEMHAFCGDQTFKINPLDAYRYEITITKQQTNNIIKEKTWSLEWIYPNGSHITIITGTVRTK